MTEETKTNPDGIERQPLRVFSEKAYLDIFDVCDSGSRVAAYW